MQRLWNRPSYPIWSLSTQDEQGQSNMNICTYVTATSLTPKRFMVALYQGTKTLANIQQQPEALLQLLAPDQIDTIRLCGKQSGFKRDKLPLLRKKHEILSYEGLPYFAEGCGFMHLHFDQLIEDAGDHVIGLASVLRSRSLSDQDPLTTQDLREHGIIRA